MADLTLRRRRHDESQKERHKENIVNTMISKEKAERV